MRIIDIKKLIYIFSALLFIAILTGCGGVMVDDDSWEDEILYAQECGMDGLPCCVDKEPECQYGQTCCTDPNNIKRNMCSDNCGCGGENKFCCKDDPKCDIGLACDNSICLTCGGLDQPCCEESECSGELSCLNDRCVKCGLSGNPCCSTDPVCENLDIAALNRTECRRGLCIFCGTAGKPACENKPACSIGHLNNNDSCFRCGGFNQPCCDENSGALFRCDSEKNLECKLGFCSKKK